jgi:hypothetical protein
MRPFASYSYDTPSTVVTAWGPAPSSSTGER